MGPGPGNNPTILGVSHIPIGRTHISHKQRRQLRGILQPPSRRTHCQNLPIGHPRFVSHLQQLHQRTTTSAVATTTTSAIHRLPQKPQRCRQRCPPHYPQLLYTLKLVSIKALLALPATLFLCLYAQRIHIRIHLILTRHFRRKLKIHRKFIARIVKIHKTRASLR